MKLPGCLTWSPLILFAAALLAAGCGPVYGNVTGSIAVQRADGSQERQRGATITFCRSGRYLEVTADQDGNFGAPLMAGEYTYSVVDSEGREWGPGPDTVVVPADGSATLDILVGPHWLSAGNLGGLVCEVTLPAQTAIGCLPGVELTIFTASGVAATAVSDDYGAYRIQLAPGTYEGLATHPGLSDDLLPIVSVAGEGPSRANW